MSDRRIPFGQFGGNFLDLVLTADTLGQQIGAAVRGVPAALLTAETQVDSHVVRYSAALGQVTVARTQAEDAFHFAVDLPVSITIEVHEKNLEWINSGYTASAIVRLQLTGVTLDPLVIFLDSTPVTPDSVTATVDMTHGGPLEAALNAEGQVEKAVKEQLARRAPEGARRRSGEPSRRRVRARTRGADRRELRCHGDRRTRERG